MKSFYPARDFITQHFTEKTFLVAEVMVKHPLVDFSATRDSADARSGKTTRGKFLQGRIQNPSPGAFGITHGNLRDFFPQTRHQN